MLQVGSINRNFILAQFLKGLGRHVDAPTQVEPRLHFRGRHSFVEGSVGSLLGDGRNGTVMREGLLSDVERLPVLFGSGLRGLEVLIPPLLVKERLHDLVPLLLFGRPLKVLGLLVLIELLPQLFPTLGYHPGPLLLVFECDYMVLVDLVLNSLVYQLVDLFVLLSLRTKDFRGEVLGTLD